MFINSTSDQGYARTKVKKLEPIKSNQGSKLLYQLSNSPILFKKNYSIKYSKKIDNKTFVQSSSNSPKIEKSFSSQKSSFLRSKILHPVTARAVEYEKAIRAFLGIKINDTEIPKSSKSKINPKILIKSSNGSNKNDPFNDFNEMLKSIEVKELNLQRNLRDINLKQKVVDENRSFNKSPALRQGAEGKKIVNNLGKQREESKLKIYNSIQGVNKILTNLLKPLNPK